MKVIRGQVADKQTHRRMGIPHRRNEFDRDFPKVYVVTPNLIQQKPSIEGGRRKRLWVPKNK